MAALLENMSLILIASTIACFTVHLGGVFGCDRYFDEYILTQESGVANYSGYASSPNFPNNYPNKLQCVYTFVAEPNRRVQLQFEVFMLHGSAPKCGDYLDIYSELQDPNLDNLATIQLSGRYCGSVSPRVRISLHQTIVLVFHVKDDSPGHRGFNIKFDFISEDMYKIDNKTEPLPDSVNGECGFVLNGESGKNYSIYSPTYPGKYPPNIKCRYILKGDDQIRTRIKLSFRDFDLFYGGGHCPYDALTIYDGAHNKTPVIQRMCGLQQLIDVYSFGPNLYLEFFTVDPPFAEHRGFHIDARFGLDFVNIAELIQGDQSIKHLSGTQCDLRLTSRGESNHTIRSPNFPKPYPPETTCTYYLDGYQGARSLEKVNLSFVNFSISAQKSDITPAPTATGPAAVCPLSYVNIDSSMLDDKAGDTAAGADDDTDTALCGDEPGYTDKKTGVYKLVPSIESKGPRMTVTIQTASAANESVEQDWSQPINTGFLARVNFRTDFGIPGNHSGNSSDCMFNFSSTATSKWGHFNSPRYPDNYPLNITCTYFLIGQPKEVIRIQFENFELAYGPDKANPDCKDNVTFYNMLDDKRTTLLSHYCWNNYPGPTVSYDGVHRVKVVFHSDTRSAAMGFRAMYEFLPTEPYPAETKPAVCGKVYTGMTGGAIQLLLNGSKYEKKWICYWDITVRPKYNILLQPAAIKIEGGIEETVQNCRPAVIRIYDDPLKEPTREWCGEKVLPEMRDYVSKGNKLRLSFLVADKINGMPGFNFSWTEIRIRQDGEPADPPCNGSDQFRCQYTHFCISRELVCNQWMNCGDGDHSDEMHCKQFVGKKQARVKMITVASVLSTSDHGNGFSEGAIPNRGQMLRIDDIAQSPSQNNSSSSSPGAEPDSNTTGILTGVGVGVVILLIIVVVCVIAKKHKRRTKEDRRSMIAQRMALNPAGSSTSEDYNAYR